MAEVRGDGVNLLFPHGTSDLPDRTGETLPHLGDDNRPDFGTRSGPARDSAATVRRSDDSGGRRPPTRLRLPDYAAANRHLASARDYLTDAVEYRRIGAHEAARTFDRRAAVEIRAALLELPTEDNR